MAKKTDASANEVEVELLSHVTHDGKEYGHGLTISVRADAAAALIRVGAAKPPAVATAKDDAPQGAE